MTKKAGTIFFCLVLVAIVVGVYWPITRTFYQQDEWLGYGLFLSKGSGFITQTAGGILGIIFGQGRILTNLLYFIFFKYSPLNVFPVSIFAISLHITNTLLVFYLAIKFFKNYKYAFLAALFFALNSISQNSITWAAASIDTLPSMTLILVALICYFKYLDQFKTKYLFISFLLIYASLFFKETGIFLLLLLPILSLIFKKYSLPGFVKAYWYFFFSVIVVVAFRMFQFMYMPRPEALFLTGSSKYFFDTLVIRSVLYPLTSFSLTFVPSESFVWFARYIENVYYPFFMPQEFILIAQTVVLDLLAIILSFSLFTVIFMFARKSSGIEKKTISFYVILMLSSFLPYIIIGKNYAYLESRYFYLATFTGAMILGWLLKRIVQETKLIYLKFLFLFIFICFLGIHIGFLRSYVSSDVVVSQERISFLDQMLLQVPTLSANKNVFYISSDQDYYVEGNKVPFQEGFGYTLMTIYYKSGKIPKELFDGQYLFDIGGQGYKEAGGHGFGYFTDAAKLKQFIKQRGVTVISLYYDSKKRELRQSDPSVLMR